MEKVSSDSVLGLYFPGLTTMLTVFDVHQLSIPVWLAEILTD